MQRFTLLWYNLLRGTVYNHFHCYAVTVNEGETLGRYLFTFAQMTAPGSVQSPSRRELKKVTTGEWENGASQRSYISPFSGLLRDWVTRVHYCLPELPWSWGLCPHIWLKMAFFFVTKQQGYASFVSKNTTHSLTHKYDLPGMRYVL